MGEVGGDRQEQHRSEVCGKFHVHAKVVVRHCDVCVRHHRAPATAIPSVTPSSECVGIVGVVECEYVLPRPDSKCCNARACVGGLFLSMPCSVAIVVPC